MKIFHLDVCRQRQHRLVGVLFGTRQGREACLLSESRILPAALATLVGKRVNHPSTKCVAQSNGDEARSGAYIIVSFEAGALTASFAYWY